LQIWLSKTEIAYLEHPRPLRKCKNTVLDASKQHFRDLKRAMRESSSRGAVTHVRRGLTQSDF
jgi:hypothetical protein